MENKHKEESRLLVIAYTEEEYKSLAAAGKYTALNESALVKMLVVSRIHELKEKGTITFQYRFDKPYSRETYKKIAFVIKGEENIAILTSLLDCTPLNVSAFIKEITSPCIEQIIKNKRWGIET